MEDFKGQTKQVTWHIPSKYTKEMAKRTEVVSSMCSLAICSIYLPHLQVR